MTLKNEKELSLSTKIAQALHYNDPDTDPSFHQLSTRLLIHAMKTMNPVRLIGIGEMGIRPLK